MIYCIKKINLKKTLLLILTLLCAFSLSIAQEQGLNHVVNYCYKDYYASEQNWGAVECDNGMQYFANSYGVLEYDGSNWRLIELPNHTIARVLAKDNYGKIYVGGKNELGYLTSNNKGEIVYVSLIDKIPKSVDLVNDIWSITILDNAVYFLTYTHIFILKDDKIKVIEAHDYFAGSFSYDNQMYYWADGLGLIKIQNDSIVSIPHGNFFKDNRIWDFAVTKDNKILALDEEFNFYTIDLSLNNVTSREDFIYESHFELSEQIKDLEIYTYTILEDGSFGFATFSGFYQFSKDGKLIQKLDSKSELLSDIIWGLYQDSSGLLWLCTDNGISKIEINSKLHSWGISQGVSGRPVDMLRVDSNLLLASLSGMQYVKNFNVVDAEIVTNDCETFLRFENPENPLLPIYLVSTYDEGVLQINGNQTTNLIKIYVWKMLQSSKIPSLVYLAADDGLHIIEYKNSKWHNLGKISGIDAEIIDVFEDDNKNIWLGSKANGIYKIITSKNPIEPNSIIQYGINDGLPSLRDIIILKLNNQLYFGTSKGLYRFSEEENSFVADTLFGIEYCNGSRRISSLRLDSLDRIWISGDINGKPFISVAKHNINGSYTVANAPFAAMNNSVVSLLYVEKDSTIWFGGPEGLYKFKGEIPEGPKSYPCYIRKVKLKNDSAIYWGPQLSPNITYQSNESNIDYKFNQISFTFVSPFYYSEDLTEYQTWLEGFENEWSDWSIDNKISFLNLKEGDYIFHVRAKNIYGEISEEDVFIFTILPPWYRTWWAYILYVIFIIAFVWLIIFLNTLRLKHKNELLKQIVKNRTRDISNQKEKLQFQAKKLKESNLTLNQLNSTKDKFFTIISHDLRSPFNSILGFTNLLVEDDNNLDKDCRKTIINSLNRSSQHAYQLLENLLDWARTQNGQIEINKEKLNLKELAEDSISPYKDNALQKNITIVIDIHSDTMILIDRNTAKTFIANLVNNAIKFTNNGGNITINCTENKNDLVLHIIDTGVGMSSEVVEKLFRIDQNVTTYGTNNEKGTGLGLILCKEFINKNNGDISVKSEEGKGSEFIITLHDAIVN